MQPQGYCLAIAAVWPERIVIRPPHHAVHIYLDTQTIKLNKPMSMEVLHDALTDMFENDYALTDYDYPLIPITRTLFEFRYSWAFEDNTSRNNVRNSTWKECGNIYQCVIPVGKIYHDRKIHWQSEDGAEGGTIEPGGPIRITREQHLMVATGATGGWYKFPVGGFSTPIYVPFADKSNIHRPDLVPIDCRDAIKGWIDPKSAPLRMGTFVAVYEY